jgi:hypothetical protein
VSDCAGRYDTQDECNELPAIVLDVQSCAGLESDLARIFPGIHTGNGDHMTWADHAG